jgi:HK97 family phage major capsid protein
MHKSAQQLVSEYQQIFARADAEGRDLTLAEHKQVQELVESAKTAKSVEDFSRQIGKSTSDQTAAGPGDIFISSAGYKAVRASDLRPQQWSSGPVEVISGTGMQAKGTLLESGAGGPGGGLVPPMYQPGVVSKLFEPLGVADVFGQSTTTASQVRYAIEGTATNAAGGVAEGAAKPESTLAYSEVVEPVKKVATWLPVSDEMLEDAPSMQSYLNQRLSLFVRVEEERQLLRGAGTNELVGIFGRSGINQFTRPAADDNATCLAKVVANTFGSSFLYPTAIVMHPTNWLNTRLLRDGTGGTVGQFLGGGPFTGAYGQGNVASAGLFGGYLWNLPVVLSNYTGPGTALVANFREGAHIWRRGGVTVEATNSHDQFFRLNLTAMRAESRLALGVYRPTAVTEVRGLA